MKRYIRAIIEKIRSLFVGNCHITATTYRSQIHSTAKIRQHARVYGSTVGKYTYISRNTLVQNSEIGAFCSISEDCNIGMPTHPTDFVSSSPVFLQGGNCLKKHFSEHPYQPCARTVIGNDVWIGAQAQIKSGVRIGNGAVIGAGAVVTKDIPAYAIVGGVPAKLIRYRFDEKTVAQLEQWQWWALSDAEIKDLAPYFSDPQKAIEIQINKNNRKGGKDA